MQYIEFGLLFTLTGEYKLKNLNLSPVMMHISKICSLFEKYMVEAPEFYIIGILGVDLQECAK